jgi:hypothetical protein
MGFDYTNRISPRPTIFSYPNHSPTLYALLSKYDPYDYYRHYGFEAFASTKLIDFTRFKVTYSDYKERIAPVNTDFSVFRNDEDPRPSLAAVEGHLRSMGVALSFDSRPLIRNKGVDQQIPLIQYARFEAGLEYASPDFIENDFDFRRYYVEFERRQRTLGLGISTLRFYAGTSDGDLPPQKYFVADFGNFYFFNARGFNTLDETNFAGNRILAINARHDFKRRLWVASGLPYIEDIPLWLSLHVGVFWSQFRDHRSYPGDDYLLVAERPYREVGFSIGNLTPFLMPFNLLIDFSWQISKYDSNARSIELGIEF